MGPLDTKHVVGHARTDKFKGLNILERSRVRVGRCHRGTGGVFTEHH